MEFDIWVADVVHQGSYYSTCVYSILIKEMLYKKSF